MSEQKRVGVIIRQSYAAFWKEWIVLAIAMVVIVQPAMIVDFIESRAGAGIFDGIPASQVMQGIGLIGVVYSLIYKIGYDLLANRYLLDSDEVVEIYGVIQKNRRVTKLEHIRRVSVEIGFVGRILGYGDVLYFTAGSAGADVRLKSIPNPEALAAEADALAQEKQARMRQAGRKPSSASALGAGEEAGVEAPQDSSEIEGQLLGAFTEAVAESVEVQREILSAIRELRTETRRSAITIQAALAGQPAPTSKSAVEFSAEGEGDEVNSGLSGDSFESRRDTEQSFYPDAPGSSEEEGKPQAEEEGSTVEEISSEIEPDPYASTPKMFGTWEEVLAPSDPSNQAQDKSAVDGSGSASTPGSPSTSESASEDMGESSSSTDPEGDKDFIGLLSPKRK